MNNGKLNSIVCDLKAILCVDITQHQASDWYELARYYNKSSKNADYIDQLFCIMCFDGNILIESNCKYTVKQFLYAIAFKECQYRHFTVRDVNYFINKSI